MDEGSYKHSQRLLAEQTRMLYEAAVNSAAATLVTSSVLVFVLWTVVDHQKLVIWQVAMVLTLFARVFIYRAYKVASPEDSQVQPWVHRYLSVVLMTAWLWGAAIVWLFPTESVEHQVFVAFVIGGMCAGAVTSLSFLKLPVLCYLGFSLVPLGIQFLMSDSSLSLPMAIMVWFFGVIVVMSALRIYENTALNITLRLDAADRERALRESEERYRTIFESAPLGVVHYDGHGVVQSFNSVLSNQMGLSREVEEGKSLYESLNHGDAREALDQSLHGQLGIYTGEMFADERGQSLYVRIYFRGITSVDESIVGGVAMIEDLTDDRRVERLKNEFVSTVSHELRTPLTAIRGSLGLLSSGLIEGKLEGQPEMRSQLLDNANRNTTRLLALINDILDIDKIEQGKLEYHMTNLKVMPFVEKAVEDNQTYASQHDVNIVITQRCDTCSVNGDEQRLMQVMSNLLSNACKFSPEKGVVEVSVTEGTKDDEVRISVQDYGAGIPEAFHERLFERFTQYDGSDIRKAGGTGLGLSITKAIIAHHKGRLEFESQEGEGARFDVYLPLLGK